MVLKMKKDHCINEPVGGKTFLESFCFVCVLRCDELEGGWREVPAAPISVPGPLLRSRGQNQCLSWGYHSSSSSILIFHLFFFLFRQCRHHHHHHHDVSWPEGSFSPTGSAHSPADTGSAVSAPSLLRHHLPWHAACFRKGSIQALLPYVIINTGTQLKGRIFKSQSICETRVLLVTSAIFRIF